MASTTHGRSLSPDPPQGFKKTKGAAKPYGIEYEYKLAGLLALRARRKGLRFRIWTNVGVAGKFDDIVLRVLAPQSVTVLMQLKHTDKSSKVGMQDFTEEKGDFSLKKYLKSYVDFVNKHARRETLENKEEALLHDCALEDLRLVIYTNKRVSREKGATDAPHLNFPFDDLLRTGSSNPLSAFSFGKADTKVWNMNVGYSQKTVFQREFLPRLRVFSKQAHVKELDKLIREELSLLFGAPLPRMEQNVTDYISLVREWALDDAKEYALRCYSGELEKILVKDLAQEARKAAGTGGLVFQREHCMELRKLLDTMKSGTLLVTVPEVPPGLRAAKLLQVLDEDFPGLWTYVDDQALREFPPAALEAACGACDVLVLDVEEELVRGRNLFATVCKSLQVVVVTSRGDANPLEGMAPRWEAPEEDWRLSHLTPDAQEKMMDATILFQGRPLQLRALEVTWPALREEVDGALLSALVRGKGAALGVAPPAPDGEEMYFPRTLEHASALSLDVLTQVDPLKDHLALSGFPPLLLEQMTKKSIAQPDEETCELEEKDDGKQAETMDDGRTDAIRQRQNLRNKVRNINKRRAVLLCEDEDSYNELCRYNCDRNVHWLQCHGEGEELRVSWKWTNGSAAAVAPFVLPVSDACSRAPKCVHATDAVRDAAAWGSKTGLLVGEPGIGKTQFLQRLAAEALERAPGRWTVMVQAQEHRKFLDELPDPEGLQMEHVVELLAEAAMGPSVRKASRRFLEAALFQTGAIVVFIDGVDEVCPAFEDKLIQLLKLLLETRVQLVWVSSRPQVEVRLSQVLRCQTSSLRPLSKAEKKSYLCKYWSSSNKCAPTVFEILADALVEALHKTTLHEQERSLLDVPLHTLMVAEVFEAAARVIAGNTEPPNCNVRITLYELYMSFVDKKRKLFKKRFGLDDPHFKNIAFPDVFDDVHQNCAMFVMISDGAFDSIDLSPFREYIEKNENHLDKEKNGLLWLREDGTPHFAHYSFVEFFAASWMFSHANHPSTKTVWQSFEIERDGKGVKHFLERMLTKGLPLHEAVLEGDDQALNEALAKRNPNEADRFGRLALHLAASLGTDKAVNALIAQGSDLTHRDSVLKWTPLQYAAMTPSPKAIESLLSAGADFSEVSLDMNTIKRVLLTSVDLNHPKVVRGILESQTSEMASELFRPLMEEMTPDNELFLHRAAKRGHYEIMKILVEHGADIHAVNSMKETSLMLAARSGSESAVQLLLQHGADLHASCKLGSALHFAAMHGRCQTMELLIKKGADVNAVSEKNMTPLLLAIESDNVSSVELLFKHGAYIHGSNIEATQSIWTAWKGHPSILKVLLKNGAQPNERNAELETPLILVIDGNSSRVQSLLENGADVNACDVNKETALHRAVRINKITILSLLLENGANVDAESVDKYTPLMLAAANGREKCARILLEHNARVNACDANKWTPLHFAAWKGYHEILKLLVEHGAEVNAVNIWKETPLILAVKHHTKSPVGFVFLDSFEAVLKDGKLDYSWTLAIKGCHEDIINLLLEKGANVNVIDSWNKTPLSIAVKRGNKTIVQLLLQHGADVEVQDSNGK